MKPSIAVDITARDKTAAGRKAAERGFGEFARKTNATAKDTGIGRLGKQLDGLTKFRNVNFGFESAGRSLATIGQVSGQVSGGIGAATERMVGFGAASESVLGRVAASAGLATGAVAALGVVLVGATVATYMMAEKWAKAGAEIDRTSRTVGVTSLQLQSARAAAERFGVSADSTTASIDSLGSTLYDAKYGANNLALGALTQLGVKLKQTKDGAVDVNQAMLDIADAIARQKDPQVQKKLAAVFGMSAMLPALRQGSAALRREGADFAASRAALTDQEVARAVTLNRKTVTVRQHLGGLEKAAGMAAMAATDRVLGDNPGAVAERAVTVLTGGAESLAKGGEKAARAIVDGAQKAGRALSNWVQSGQGDFNAFAGRIEHQESRGRQFDRNGNPLTSSAGAVGVMQMLPETAMRAAKWAGMEWDSKRFARDPEYNRALGRAELRRLLEKFGGDQVLAAAAYNAGEGRLEGYTKRGQHYEGWLERFGDPRKGEISDADFAAKIPFKETRDYVANTATKAHVEITLRGAPPGTVAKVTGGQGLNVDMHVARSMEGP